MVVVAQVSENVASGVVAGVPDGGADLGLEGGEEGLGDRIIEARSGSASRRADAVTGERGAEQSGAVLRPAIGVKDRVVAGQAASDGEVEGVADQVGTHVVGHRVPDDLAVVQVDDRGQVEPPLPRGQVRDVPDQSSARCRGGEVPADQVRYRCRDGIGPGQ